MLAHLLYVSRCRSQEGPSHADIDHLLDSARRFNADHGVTGMLLCVRGRFMQILEGPPASLQDAMDRIRNDPLHHDLEVLSEGGGHRRLFGEWAMAYRGPWDVAVDASVASMDRLMRRGGAPDRALEALQAFWTGRDRGQA